MKLVIEPKIFEMFPCVVIGVVIISDMVNDRNVEEIMALLRQEETHQKEILTGVELGSLPEITAWREIYRKFGSNAKDFRSSIESLLRRARGGSKPLPDINPLVNLYNYLSLKYHVPVGAEDLAKVTGDIVLGFADGSEKGIALGSDVEESCDSGEVVYTDDLGFLCRRWNWREADRTKIDPTTKRAVMVLEKVPEVSAESFQNALTEAKALIEPHLLAQCAIMVLDEEHPEVEL